jgi:hypothetical protein
MDLTTVAPHFFKAEDLDNLGGAGKKGHVKQIGAKPEGAK